MHYTPGTNGTPASYTDADRDRSFYHDPALELGLVGAAIWEPSCLHAVACMLTADDLGHDDYAAVLRVVLEMHSAGQAVDPTLLCAELELRGRTFPHLADGHVLGSDALVSRLVDGRANEPAIYDYIDRIREHSQRRKLAEVSDMIRDTARDGSESAGIIGRARALLDGVDAGPRKGGYQVGAIDSCAFARAEYPRRFIVDDILVEGQPGGLIGPRKSMKTTIGLDLGLSGASGTPFLGTFRVARPVRTLILSGESGAATLQETAHRIAAAKGFELEELGDRLLWGFNLPHLSNPAHLGAVGRFLEAKQIGLAMFDPMYLMLLAGSTGIDASNMFHVGPLMAAVTETCLKAGCTPLFVHHFRKNREAPHELPELDDVAYAGMTEFLRQWILTGRRETYPPGSGQHKLWLAVGGSSGHSGAWAVDVTEGVVDREFRGRTWGVTVLPASHARQGVQEAEQEARAAKEAEKAKAKDEAVARRVGEQAAEAMKILGQVGSMTASDWRARLRLNPDNFKPVLLYLLDSKQVRECMIEVACGKGARQTVGYAPVAGTPDQHLFVRVRHTRTAHPTSSTPLP